MSDFKHYTFDLISSFTGQRNNLTVNVTLIDFGGDLETGLFLSQLIYWADRGTRQDGYFYKTDDDWYEEIRLSKYAVRKARKNLEELGILETKVKKANGNPTLHYKFNKDNFTELFISFLRKRKNESLESKERTCENELSLTDITTETTSDTNNNINTVSEKEAILEIQFDQFWNTYPRKLDKKKALKSFKAALKKYPFEKILNGTANYALHVKNSKIESQYIKHATTFLNNESFLNEYETKRNEVDALGYDISQYKNVF